MYLTILRDGDDSSGSNFLPNFNLQIYFEKSKIEIFFFFWGVGGLIVEMFFVRVGFRFFCGKEFRFISGEGMKFIFVILGREGGLKLFYGGG